MAPTPTTTLSLAGIAVVLCIALVQTMAGSTLQFLESDVSRNIRLMQSKEYSPYREFNEVVNDVFFTYTGLGAIPAAVKQSKLGHDSSYYLLCYLRDLVLGTMVYWVTAGVWHIYIYRIAGDRLFTSKGRKFPTAATIRGQMQLAQTSLLLYAGLPIVSEFLIENGFTKTYFYVEEVGGWGWYGAYLLLYIAVVEVGIYWMHRTLHENKFLYMYVHRLHHQYKDAESLTPWASIAFNPIDGLLQACPYVLALLLVPCHYFTHVGLLFFSGVWATNIHDSVPANSEPVMGAKYHTIHHTDYKCNYGQFFIFCDLFWGTLWTESRLKQGQQSCSSIDLSAASAPSPSSSSSSSTASSSSSKGDKLR